MRAPARRPACVLFAVLCLTAVLTLPGCQSDDRLISTLFEGVGDEEPPPMNGITGPERDAWLGPLAPLAADSDIAELELAFEELPGGQTRRWINFDTQTRWEVAPRRPAGTPQGHRLLLTVARPETGAPARWVLAAERTEKGRWLPAETDHRHREALLDAGL